MPSRPPRVCPKCRKVVSPNTPCPICTPRDTRASNARRGNSYQRGYGRVHRQRFRLGVLARDPVCVCDQTCYDHGRLAHTPGDCDHVSTVADHWPLTKRELKAQGLDDHDPKHGRGICKPCHDRHTARSSPGGWHRDG